MQRKVHKSSEVSASRRPKDCGASVPPVPPTSDSRSNFLLDSAAELFLQKGFEATSVGEIAHRAHASKETFYNKFTNKNELFRAVIHRLTDRFASDIGLALGKNQEPRQALSAFGAILLGRLLSDEGIGLQNIVFMESRRFPEIASIFYELGPSRTLAVLAEYFDAQAKKGALRRMDSKLAASHFVGLLTSDMMMLRSLGLLGKPTPEEQAKRCRDAVEIFLRAYGQKD
ncbi:TetR/AcrR family transcriptional regulator [Tunturiibacter empetritectus]|uniref:TetR/AcrR family transcriptional regulator n=1 Tax=Tunturiibacter empetritectus TaxID=3069691 RepID=UPI00211BC0EE|nr:TetR/AcrR family transcriptional regulator [Edaphobacter lichenicola]